MLRMHAFSTQTFTIPLLNGHLHTACFRAALLRTMLVRARYIKMFCTTGTLVTPQLLVLSVYSNFQRLELNTAFCWLDNTESLLRQKDFLNEACLAHFPERKNSQCTKRNSKLAFIQQPFLVVVSLMLVKLIKRHYRPTLPLLLSKTTWAVLGMSERNKCQGSLVKITHITSWLNMWKGLD